MKKTVLLMALTGFSAGLFAQMEPGQKTVTNNSPEAFVQSGNPISEDRNIRDMINDLLASKGWNEGKNTGKDGKEFFIASGIGAIDAPRDHAAYIASRTIAYNKAMLAAKRDMAEFIKNAIETKTEKTVQEDDELTDAAFCKMIETEANQYILGMQSLCSFEHTPAGKNGQIGVIAVWSPKLQQMAEAISTGKMVATGMPQKTLQEQIPADPLVLMTTFGIQQKLDEKGNLVLVAFGQDGAVRDTDRAADAATRKAQMNAQAAIREFAGENIAVNSVKSDAEDITEFNNAAREFANDSRFEEKIRTVASRMEISGISTFKRWQVKHPITGQTVYGVVCIWSPELSKQAKDLGGILNPSGKPGKSAATPSGKKTPVKVESGKSFSGTGQNADENAF
jgi:hypothetical protein